MPNIRIKELEGRVATAGVHFGLGPRVPKLEPGEVLALEEGALLEKILATGKVELTREAATRPFEYASEAEARYCRPSYTPRDPSEEQEMLRARNEVAERLAAEREAAAIAEPATEPASEESATATSEGGAFDEMPARRTRRRARAERAQTSEQDTAG